MATYRYQIRNSAGQMQVGALHAESVAAAANALRRQGAHVLSIAPVSGGAVDRGALVKRLKELNAGKPGQKHVLDFTTQLAVMIRAGINLRASLEGIAEQTEHAQFRKVIASLKTDVESGKQFSEAIARHPKLFGPLYVNMVRASEMSGSFSSMLNRIADYIGQQIETRKMVIGACIYPGVIGTLAIVVTIFLLTFVLPRFYTVFEGKEEILPWATKFLMNTSQTLVANWMYIVGGVITAGVGAFLFIRTDMGRLFVDRAKITIPIMRTMFRSLYISRSLQTMGQLINAGVPMLDTLAITGDISGNRLYKGMWRQVYAAVKQGRKIIHPLSSTKLLPRAVVQMIAAGEESGKLGEVLDEISGFYAKQLKTHIKAVTSMIEPIMIILMGAVVGFIAMAIILPIFKMSQVVS